jgi:hypothetical protein
MLRISRLGGLDDWLLQEFRMRAANNANRSRCFHRRNLFFFLIPSISTKKPASAFIFLRLLHLVPERSRSVEASSFISIKMNSDGDAATTMLLADATNKKLVIKF